MLKVTSDHRGDTDRAVYTVRFANRVYAVHAFQKKSKRGIATPQPEIDLIKRRLTQAIAISEGRESDDGEERPAEALAKAGLARALVERRGLTQAEAAEVSRSTS